MKLNMIHPTKISIHSKSITSQLKLLQLRLHIGSQYHKEVEMHMLYIKTIQQITQLCRAPIYLSNLPPFVTHQTSYSASNCIYSPATGPVFPTYTLPSSCLSYFDATLTIFCQFQSQFPHKAFPAHKGPSSLLSLPS